MAIHKKDRSFQNIIREVDIDEIPLTYIHSLTLILDNGDRVKVSFDDEMLGELEDTSMVNVIKTISDEIMEQHQNSVQDIEIIINYKKIEDDVLSKTQTLLSGDVSNDSSNSSL